VKFAVCVPMDQTYLYLTADKSWTTKHPEAELFDSRDAADQATNESEAQIEEVADETEFRARKDTW
jgi:hypothetical protein